MLMMITTTHNPATDIGILLHKSPFRCQSSKLSFGTVNIFYPEAAEERCTMAMLIEMDTIGMVRGRKGISLSALMDQYINDRPYVASSFISVAIARIFGSALNGRCNKRPDLVDVQMPFTVSLPVLPCNGGETFLKSLFEPIGYKVSAKRLTLDEKFPEWGDSLYFSVELEKTTTLKDLLTNLYVLIPVLDDKKHYYVDSTEIDKLLIRGQGWLASHPEKELIAKRYLKHKMSYAREALARLTEEIPQEINPVGDNAALTEETIEKKLNLNDIRLSVVFEELKNSGAQSVIDLGCGEGKLLKMLLRDKQFQKITGMDVSIRSLESAGEYLRLDSLPPMQKQRIHLMHGSLMYRDRRLEGYDAASIIEVIEHLDQARLTAFERVIFEFARPKTLIITTPNKEYNVMWESLSAENFRHIDHRFEWTRDEFRGWASNIADKYGYEVSFKPVGAVESKIGSPTQMAVFSRRTM